jgi:hypothetical protein
MIDIRDYDLALVDRIKTFYDNTHWVNRPSLPIQELRDRKLLNGEDVDFPIITVRRTNCPVFSKEYNSWARAKTGQSYLTGDNQSGSKKLQDFDPELALTIIESGHSDAVSVVNSTFELTYYIDVISFERDNFDTIMVELQENLFSIPYIGFYNFKSNGHQDKLIKGQACHLFVEEVEDTSDLENFDSGNALYRATITVKINAYIYRKYRSNVVEQFNLESNVIPWWLYQYGNSSIADYVSSDVFSDRLKEFGFDNLLDYAKSIGFNSVDELLEAIRSGKWLSTLFKLGPDLFTLEFKIPAKLDEEKP